jgi:sec-independent protein translocase protein TatA
MFSRIGLSELLVLFVIILLLFGPRRLPELAKSLGEKLKLFKQGLKDDAEEKKGSSADHSSPKSS